jgi:predicted glycoside hydrolase/deacetylase ChbG (UPF0249 family)
MARLLVVNADDFGRSAGINDGVLRAHREGIVSSASLMVNGVAAEAAVSEALSAPELSIGLHFVEPRGVDIDDPGLLREALEAQLNEFERLTGRLPTHLDSHHHVHFENERAATFAWLAAELGVPFRGRADIRYVGGFYGQRESGETDLRRIGRDELKRLLRSEVRAQATELSCHPAASLDGLDSVYCAERLVELETLTSPGLGAQLRGLGIRLVSFRELAG